MNIELHLVFLRHDERVEAGVDALAQEVLSDFLVDLKAELNCEASLAVFVPRWRSYLSRDQFLSFGTAAPRLWADITVQTSDVFDLEKYNNRTGELNEVLDSACSLVSRFTGVMDRLLPSKILASNISNPGILGLMGGVLSVDQHPICSPGEMVNDLWDDLADARALGWPQEVPVSFSQAKLWVEKILKSYPVTAGPRVSRALAAFSHLAAARSNGGNDLELFWAMMGLEAIYCDGTEGLKKQLFEKASVLFGPLSENRRRIRGLYDFRSAFVHGSKDIPYAFTTDFDDHGVESFQTELFGASSVAFLLLVASLQFMVSKDMNGLDFRYVLAEQYPAE